MQPETERAAQYSEPLEVIYDCDNTMGHPRSEIDDGLTLLYLLGCPELELIAVTTTFGNGPEAVVADCTRRLLAEVGRQDVAVLRGARQAGDWDTEAAAFLAERVSRARRPLALLATGPLGNLAGAARRSTDVFATLRKVALMGGTLSAPLRVGWRQLKELNLSADAPAAARVIAAASSSTDTALFNAHVCLQAPFGAASYLRLRRQVRWWPEHRLKQVRNWLLRFGLRYGVPCFYLWDLLPAVWLTAPQLFSAERCALAEDPRPLQQGLLRGTEDERTPRLLLPSRIIDRRGFYERLFAAWASRPPPSTPGLCGPLAERDTRDMNRAYPGDERNRTDL